MELTLYRFSSQDEDTLGLLAIDCMFECFILEDEYRNVKKYGETRIPNGRYEIKLRKEGGFHQRYSDKFGDDHKGMLWLQDVPGFEYVLIHIGNDDDDTAGCLLVGDGCNSNIPYAKGSITNSTQAYKRFYPKVAHKLEQGDKVFITIKDNGEWM